MSKNQRRKTTPPTPTAAGDGNVTRTHRSNDILVGMKAICRYIHRSEATALKYHRELDMPMRKSDKNGTTGQWISSKSKLDAWAQSLIEG